MKRLASITALAVVLVLSAGACARTFSAGVAVVNGKRITTEALDREVKIAQQSGRVQPGDDGVIQAQRQALEDLIKRELLRQEAQRRGVEAVKADIDEQFEQIRGQFPSQEEFNSRLREAGFTEETLRAAISEQSTIRQLQQALAGQITEANIREVYETEKEQFRQARVRHVLFQVDDDMSQAQARTAARAALAQLRAGEITFAALVAKSDDVSSRATGGFVEMSGQPYVNLAELDPQFAAATWEASLRTVVGPVETSFGYHLIEVFRKRYQPLSAVREQLRSQLAEQLGGRALQEFVVKASENADIEVNPRYGDWDPETGTVVPHKFYEPAEPALDENDPNSFLPPGFAPQDPSTQSPEGGAPESDAPSGDWVLGSCGAK
ncbi:MAG TPA: SurA N-terminal domain-containing protein, partial [Actinomycetota bacterium]|nr:SurA N-terminal domain-containing protein [Actinomycetota bacterium]